jgi:hypothetical protein
VGHEFLPGKEHVLILEHSSEDAERDLACRVKSSDTRGLPLQICRA